MLANFLDEGSGVGSRAALVSRQCLGPHHQLFGSGTQGRQGLGFLLAGAWRTGAEAASTPEEPC